MISTEEVIVKKLQTQDTPKILFADLDGTLFSPDFRILTAPFYNRKTAAYLKAHSIPFVIATGRSDWNVSDRRQVALLGFSLPDCVITANGTVIYGLLTNNIYARDMEWEASMQYSKVKWADGKVESWNKLEITRVLKQYFLTQRCSCTFGTGNTFMIRIRLMNIPLSQLEQIRKDILTLFPSGLRIIYTEKLLRKNTSSIFSGEMLITPKLGGKDNAVKYLLEKYAKKIALQRIVDSSQKKDTQPSPFQIIHAFIFGDATVDIPMLTMKDNPKYYTLSQYLVHPTPLARKAGTLAQKDTIHLHILLGDGPKEIVNVLEEAVSGDARSQFSIVSDQKEGTQSVKLMTDKQDSENRKKKTENKLSAAQNNPIRQIIKNFEPLLDNIVDKNLSPNEVSFLGLTKLSEGLEKIYKPKSSSLEKIKGLYEYGFGNLTDVLDGIRARNSNKKEENGQLVDGFSDRAKEFMQLFMRARMRQGKKMHGNIISNNNEKSQSKNILHTAPDLDTLLTAISCTLPSIARAQAEILGKVVAERDAKGGSMIDRTKKLFLSLFMDIIGVHQRSAAIDQEIYSANIATFQNRLSAISYAPERALAKHTELIPSSLSDFQKEALERWLLYIDVLQQEDVIIKKYLSNQPALLKEYEKKATTLAKDYLALKVNVLRKKWHIKDYKLQIKT